MAKDLKLKIKNAQLAEAFEGFKPMKPAKKPTPKKEEGPSEVAPASKKKPKAVLFDASLRAKSKPDVSEPVKVQKPAPEKVEELSAPIETPTPVQPTPVRKPIGLVKPTPKPEAEPEPELKPAQEEPKEPEIKKEPRRPLGPVLGRKPLVSTPSSSEQSDNPNFKDKTKAPKFAERKFQEMRPRKAGAPGRTNFDGRARKGLLEDDEGARWRKKRSRAKSSASDIPVIRPSELKVRLPIALKDLASAMKLKASQIIAKLMMQGLQITINDELSDETTVELIGHEFECNISIDTTEEKRLQITDQTITEEIKASDEKDLKHRPPVVAFMGHVDHGKTSIIDAIRKSNEAAGEAGAITQHIGAFFARTSHGNITILDTPGHEAFSAMRERGATATDIVVLVIAGDEGMREQTLEALEQAKASNVTIFVAINKSDKEGFNAENVYRQLSEHELLPEAWGGSVITVNCSAVTGEGVNDLVEMLGLQAEVLELKANPDFRARGVVIESQMHKGLGSVATLLVQNGTLHPKDAVVFDTEYGRIKTMHNEHGKAIQSAPPSTPVKITGLSQLPEAGSEFIVIEAGEKEAKAIAEARAEVQTRSRSKQKKTSLEELLAQKEAVDKKVLSIILRADVQGSLEALTQAIEKIKSAKAEVNIIASGVGDISESDVELAAASSAIILGFHTKVESHAAPLIKEKKVRVLQHNIIYHATDDVREQMRLLLDKVAEEKMTGAAEVKATFKSSHLGVIAGCLVEEGTIRRTHRARLMRDGEKVWQGEIDSIKRVKEDVKEVSKGIECGICLKGTSNIKEGDRIEAFEIIYHEAEL